MLTGKANVFGHVWILVFADNLSALSSVPLVLVSQPWVVITLQFLSLEEVDLELEPLSMNHTFVVPCPRIELLQIFRIPLDILNSELL
jgi:hypothetical protein